MKIRIFKDTITFAELMANRVNSFAKDKDVISIDTSISTSHCIVTVIYKDKPVTENKPSWYELYYVDTESVRDTPMEFVLGRYNTKEEVEEAYRNNVDSINSVSGCTLHIREVGSQSKNG